MNKPSPVAEDTGLRNSSPTATEDLQLLATKPPPPLRPRYDIDEDMLFPFHASVDANPKLDGVLDYNMYPLGNASIARALSSTL